MKTQPKTITVTIPAEQLSVAVEALRNSGAKHWPFIRHWNSYSITIEDHPVATYLELKYGNRSS